MRRPPPLAIGALLLAALLPACAAPAPTPAALARREAPAVYPPSVRDRLLRIAETEWAEWGRIIVSPDLDRPATGAEGLPEHFPRLTAYWRAVAEPVAEETVARNRAAWIAAPGLPGLWGETPWSAAFVSYVMRSAGVDRREFPPSAAHGTYLDAMIRDAAEFPATAPFVPREVGERAPAPGDLVCADRSRTPLRSWRERLGEAGRFRPMHCDIVLRTGPGVVEAVGGNVADAVTLVRYDADAAGRLLPRGAGRGPVFTVVENRLGRLPPFGAALVAMR